MRLTVWVSMFVACSPHLCLTTVPSLAFVCSHYSKSPTPEFTTVWPSTREKLEFKVQTTAAWRIAPLSNIRRVLEPVSLTDRCFSLPVWTPSLPGTNLWSIFGCIILIISSDAVFVEYILQCWSMWFCSPSWRTITSAKCITYAGKNASSHPWIWL